MRAITQYPGFFTRLLRTLALSYVVVGLFGWFFADKLIFLPPAAGYSASPGVLYINNGKQRLAAIHLKNPDARYTLLYSHGNAVDIGRLGYLFDAFYQHGYSVLAYDYSGYGLSEGQASENQSYRDINAAYAYLREQGTPAENIIAYGHSLGAAVAIELASKQPVAALVLEAPFISAFRVMTRLPLYPFDKFSNIDKLPDVTAPVYIMHSRDDRVVPFWHSQKLFDIAGPDKSAYWLDNAGHDHISVSGEEYWRGLRVFVEQRLKT